MGIIHRLHVIIIVLMDSTGVTLGMSWSGMACRSDAVISGGKWGSGTGITSAGLNEWLVFAHEVKIIVQSASTECNVFCKVSIFHLYDIF
jgi:hypothetical protein